MKRGRALETIHREVVGTSAGRLALSNRLYPMPRRSEERSSYSVNCFPCKYRKCALVEAFFPRMAEPLAGEDVF